jgi:predicted nuclease of predicted toxin-antitoxin system
MRLLLDAHISPKVAAELVRRGHDVVTAAQAGVKDAEDRDVWLRAIEQSRAVVTHDRSDFPVLYAEFWESGVHHYGLVMITSASLPPHDIGAQVRALDRLLRLDPEVVDQMVFLQPADVLADQEQETG